MSETAWYHTPRDSSSQDGWRSSPRTLADLDLDSLQRAQVLEWFAFKVWVAMNEGSGDRDYSGKPYDPLTINLEANGYGVAHSYVFNFKDGGRHHPFHSLAELEEWLTDEAIQAVRYGGEDDGL